ncbi:hypothetical protein [Alteromonas sp. CYL-A6]|uniref:hypothetical protein n=1 Tax=Alteromonas nitratireducens TaxID=3390813 RepID=UPI0034B9DBEB
MKIYKNTKFVNASPPVSNISVNKNEVVFTDIKSKKNIQFNSNAETKKFIGWLLGISSNSRYPTA